MARVKRQAPVDRWQLAALSGLSLAQAVVVGWTGGGITRIVAVVLALAGLNVRVRGLWVLAGLSLINFGVHLRSVGLPIPMREAHIALPVLYGTVALAAAVAFFASIRFRTAAIVLLVPAVALIAAEAALPRLVPSAVMGARPAWFDAVSGTSLEAAGHEPYAMLRGTYAGNPRGYFQPPPEGRPSGRSAAPGVEYALNAFGCRGGDYTVPSPRESTRILLLGGSGAFGAGVHVADTVSEQLEQRLNAPPRPPAARPFDVINCGLSGSSTAEQRAFYEQVASRYEPDLVLLLMDKRDNLSSDDERRQGFVHEPGWFERFSVLARLVQWGRHEGRRPFEYEAVSAEVVQLEESVRSRGGRLAVAIFRNGDLDARWGALVGAVSGRLQGRDTPVSDLGLTLLRAHTARDLTVHPTDDSPNEMAHRAAAVELERWLRSRQLVD